MIVKKANVKLKGIGRKTYYGNESRTEQKTERYKKRDKSDKMERVE